MPGAGAVTSLCCGREMPFGGSISSVLPLLVVAYRKLCALESKYLSARKSWWKAARRVWGVREFVLSKPALTRCCGVPKLRA